MENHAKQRSLRRQHLLAAGSPARHRPWPSSNPRATSGDGVTLSDHLGKDRLLDHQSFPSPSRYPPSSTISKRSVALIESEISHRKIDFKENSRPVIGVSSMRYTTAGNKYRLPYSSRRNLDMESDIPSFESDKSSSSRSSSVATMRRSGSLRSDQVAEALNWESKKPPVPTSAIGNTSSMTPNRIPVRRWRSDFETELGSSESNVVPVPAICRSGSVPAERGTALVAWGSPAPAKGARGKAKQKKGLNLISMGLDLFRKKSSSPSTSSRDLHELKMLHGRLMQWRYVNARAQAVDRVKTAYAQMDLIMAWATLSSLRASVVQKRMQLQKQRLRFKLSRILHSQMKALGGWADLEMQHAVTLSATKDCLVAAVCRVPLIEGATVDAAQLSAAIGDGNNVAVAIKSAVKTYEFAAAKTAPTVAELARVVAEEKSLLDQSMHLLLLLSNLQIQEQSLSCHLTQLIQLKNQRIITNGLI